MDKSYDMSVDYNTLCTIEDQFQKIEQDILNVSNEMQKSISRSQAFLAGYQFEKAKATTEICTKLTDRVAKNVKASQMYISELRSLLNEYETCCYEGE